MKYDNNLSLKNNQNNIKQYKNISKHIQDGSLLPFYFKNQTE